jgi:hypothetical protein
MTGSRSWLEAALARHGLRLRGGWVPQPGDDLPLLPSGPVAVVWMVGQVGSGCWPVFSGSAIASDGQPDPLDRWSQSIGDALARQCAGRAIYPSDGPPYAPFQQWARRAEPLATSPLMLQIHPQYGLWHAYRFALALPRLDSDDAAAMATQQRLPQTDLCLSCTSQPCLSACPVDAFTATGYAVERCAGHLHGPAGADCMVSGCQARRACPVGGTYRYVQPHAAFHMAAFAERHIGVSDAVSLPNPQKREPRLP